MSTPSAGSNGSCPIRWLQEQILCSSSCCLPSVRSCLLYPPILLFSDKIHVTGAFADSNYDTSIVLKMKAPNADRYWSPYRVSRGIVAKVDIKTYQAFFKSLVST